MFSYWTFQLRQLFRQLWVTAILYSLLGVVTALSALWLEPLLPVGLTTRVGADEVDRILGILASSMLAVTTFSIATMVSAYTAAATGATPRATKLLIEDRAAQNALATFLGAFLFSVVSIIALGAGIYGRNGRAILFFVTIGVLILIVLVLVRWIDKVARLGHVAETVDEVERVALSAMCDHARAPLLGGKACTDVPRDGSPVCSGTIGYVEHVDMARLFAAAKKYKADVTLAARAGAFVTPERPIAYIEAQGDAEAMEQMEAAVRDAFTIGDSRSYDQDPRFGLIVLSEIASRALSPAVNDPGTAIDVIGTAVRILAVLPREQGAARERAREMESGKDDAEGRVFVPPLAPAEFFDNVFTPIARDGAGMIEVALRLQKALAALAAMDDAFAAPARECARLALARAEAAMTLDDDRQRVRAAARWVKETSSPPKGGSGGKAASTR